ncbi:family 10 glycosylhydrolase [Coleofasciculus sp. H7-2]|uniref:glycoside hydrolase family 10 protein n=1 Tax=Coleofasciculus sp. H7-2 TaxID=3351545 RepID=UPI00366A5DFD
MVTSPTQFSDIQTHWARLFIEALAQRRIINGFPDGTFRPNQSITRTEFATLISTAFSRPAKRQYIPFIDVPSTYWAASAIQKAYETLFISGFPDNRFRPADRITRTQVLVSLVSGLQIAANVKSDLKTALPQIYQDAAAIPSYATDEIAVATKAGLVVNYPNVKLFNPNLAATRGDVAAFIYQALVYLDEAPRIASPYIVVPPKPNAPSQTPTVKVSHQREFRGVWVATVWNSDWPSKPGLTAAQQQAELIGILDRMQAMKMNALVLQVRPEGDAFYASQLEPWSYWLTGNQGKAPEPFYDPLEYAIAQCHKRNIELHAWFNPYRARVSIKNSPPVRPHIAVTNPEAVYLWGNQTWMDPGLKVVQDRAYNVILDVVRRYDVDGIHLDDYFYPYPIEGKSFPDNKTYAAYTAAGGKLSLGEWRRDNVNQMVQRLSRGIQATKPHVKFGISPFGIYRPGQPPQIRGLDAYSVLYADSKKWLDQGWVDYLAPQLYWRIDQTAQSYPVLLKWWTDNNPKDRHIYAGNNLGQLDGKAWTLGEIEKQVEITRNLSGNLSLGNIFFSMESFVENRQGIYDKFKTSTYTKPALAPAMSWRDTTPPAPPTALGLRNGKLTWNVATNPDIRSWTLYKQSGTTWTLQRILSREITFATVEPGTYAVCAVDRMANESAGVLVIV